MRRLVAIILLFVFPSTSLSATLLDSCLISDKKITCTIKESSDELTGTKYYLLPPEKFSKMLSDINNLMKLDELNRQEIELLKQKIDLQKQMIEQYKSLMSTYDAYVKKISRDTAAYKIVLYLFLGVAVTIGAGLAIHYATK